jgi:hypothetical protein
VGFGSQGKRPGADRIPNQILLVDFKSRATVYRILYILPGSYSACRAATSIPAAGKTPLLPPLCLLFHSDLETYDKSDD